jgi:hypothetical protein
MKLVRFLVVIGIFAGLALATGCSSFDFNNPTASEWDVQIVGDSVFDLSGDIQKVLKTKSGKTYKDRSVSGAKIAAIQSQLNTALGRTTLKTVIGDGGANDILQGTADCTQSTPTLACQDVLNYVGDKVEVMLNAMYAKSPANCAFMGYYHVKGSEAPKNYAIDWAYTNIYPGIFPSTFTNGSYSRPAVFFGTPTKFKALFLDTRPYISDVHLKSDNIHPTYDGSVILAGQIWDAMVNGSMYR